MATLAGKRAYQGAQVVPSRHHDNTSNGDTDDDELEGLDMAPTDAEATIMLLRNKLYPDPATAAAAAAAAKQSRHAKRSKSATGPSKATYTAIAAAAAAAAAAKQLPPIVLKTQVYTVLTDRTAADRDLEQLRQQGRVRVFKLAIGADEYVLLLADDYLQIINQLVQKHQQLASDPQPQQQQQPAAAAAQYNGKDGSSAASDAASTAATLQLFRDHVVPAWHEASIPRATLLSLLRSAGGTAAAAASSSVRDSALERHLLAVDLVTRDSRCPDSYLLTVPGAAPFVKSVLAGRQELLQILTRKKYQEALQSELSCVKLRNSCLTPSFIIRDLQGRGLVTVTNTTAGHLIRLTHRK